MALLMVGIASGAKPRPQDINSFTLTNEPVYAGAAEFDVHLGKHYSEPLIAVWCWQSGIGAVMARHGFIVDKYGASFDGQSSVLITYHNNIGDPSQPANCAAVVFDEQRSNKRPEVALTDWVAFRVEGVD